MCGLAGVISLSSTAAPLQAQLEAAAAALRHRGPDDFGITLDGPVGLVHTRLSIIDLAGGHQPIVTPAGDVAAVVNGEIYNYVELRPQFIARGGFAPVKEKLLQPPGKQRQDRQQGAALDDDVEKITGLKTEEMLRQKEVAGGRDGDELRNSFNDSQNDDGKPIGHGG